jgi:hypothetical protein
MANLAELKKRLVAYMNGARQFTQNIKYRFYNRLL